MMTSFLDDKLDDFLLEHTHELTIHTIFKVLEKQILIEEEDLRNITISQISIDDISSVIIVNKGVNGRRVYLVEGQDVVLSASVGKDKDVICVADIYIDGSLDPEDIGDILVLAKKIYGRREIKVIFSERDTFDDMSFRDEVIDYLENNGCIMIYDDFKCLL